MRSLIHRSLVSLLFLSTPTFALTDASGRWEGTISMPEGEVRITTDLAKNDRGAWIGAITIVGTTAIDVPLDSITITDTAVKFHAGLVESPTFSGTFSADGSALSGDVANVRGAVPFQLKRTGKGKVNMPPPSTPFTQATDIEGAWSGEIKVGERTMRLALTIGAGSDGATLAKLFNTDQGNLLVPITTLIYADQELRLEARAISGSFVGKRAADGTLAGEWSQGPQKLPLVFKRARN